MRRCALEDASHSAFFRLGDDDSSALEVRFALLDMDSSVHASVELGNSHVDFSPFLFTLPSLLLPLLPPSPSPSSSPSQPSQPLSFSSCFFPLLFSPSDTKISAALSIHPIHLALYKDVASRACSFTLSVGLSAGFHSHFSRADFSCDLNSIRFVRGAAISQPSTGFNDLLIQSNVAFHCSLPNDLKEISCTLTSSPLNFVFDSFSLLQLKDIIQSTLASIKPSSSVNSLTPPPSINSLTPPPSTNSPITPSIASEVEPATHPPVVSVTVSLPLLRVILVSNTYHSILPVAFAELKNTLAAAELQEQFTSVTIKTNLAAKYFKTEYGQWEACIEPWPYAEPSSEPKTELELRADRLLSVNVTSALLRQTASYLGELDQLAILEPTSLAPLHASSPRQDETVRTETGENRGNDNFICFVNHCGKTIQVSVSNTTQTALAISEEEYAIDDGEAFYSSILAFPAFQELLQEEAVSNDYQEVTIRCDGYESVALPLYAESYSVLPPRTVVLNAEDRQRVLVAHNHIQFGRKEVVLAGRVSVVNNSGLPLFFAFMEAAAPEPELVALLNHCEVYAPAACCCGGQLVLSTEAQCSMFEGYTRAHVPLNSFDDGATAELCVQIGRKQRCVRLFATRRRLVLPTYDEVYIIRITVLPCLVIHNLLPVEVDFAISDNQNTRSGTGMVR